MSFRIGDTVFDPMGRPGVVAEQSRETGGLKIDTEKSSVQGVSRHGYLNGMDADERLSFNGIMDQMREIDGPMEQITFLRDKLDEVGQDPRQYSLRQYLNAEIAHLMQSYSIRPRFYEMDPRKAAIL